MPPQLSDRQPWTSTSYETANIDREHACDVDPPASGKLISALQAAPERGWTVVSI